MRDVLTDRSAPVGEARGRAWSSGCAAPRRSTSAHCAACGAVLASSPMTTTDTLAMLFPNVATTKRHQRCASSVSYLAEQSAPASGPLVLVLPCPDREWRRSARSNCSRAAGISSTGAATLHEVRGEGVVGEMPLIAPGASFDYVSGCPLDTPTGSMSGSYHMIDEDGAAFDVAIPRFALIGPAA